MNGALQDDEVEAMEAVPLNDDAARERVRWRRFGEEKGGGNYQELHPDPISRDWETVNGALQDDEVEAMEALPLNDDAARERVRWRRFGEEKGGRNCQEFAP